LEIAWAKAVSLGTLLADADIISVHASGDRIILGPNELKRIGKSGVTIINTARGGLIDENALYEALLDGRVGYACLDVFQREPYEGPLLNLDNVILTPHIGSYARESRRLMESCAVDNLLTGLKEIGVL
jgi:D-3-phosphoglycerate dehydrogenase